MAEVSDLLNSVIEKNPIDFAAAFNDIVGERLEAAIADKKIELAQSIYGSAEQEDEDLEVNTDSDDDLDIDLDDIDLEGLGLDDIDLEETDNDGEDA